MSQIFLLSLPHPGRVRPLLLKLSLIKQLIAKQQYLIPQGLKDLGKLTEEIIILSRTMSSLS